MTSSGLVFKHYIALYPVEAFLGEYQGTLELYNQMQGLNNDGTSIINPLTNEPTIWPISGDPVTGTGWYLGDGWPGGPIPGDWRYHVPTGPFDMAPSDTQEVVIAILIKKGTDNINSITELKDYAAQIQHWYDNDFVTDVKETMPVLDYYQQILSTLSPLMRRHSVTQTLSIAEDITLETYPGVHAQILTNLITNSISHGFSEQLKKEIKIEVTQTETNTVIRYTDNGTGLKEHSRLHIFEPFFTTARESGGIGLGMSIVFNLVKQKLHGNTQLLTPKHGFGIEFTLPTRSES